MNRLSEDGLGVTDIRRAFRARLIAQMSEANLRAADVARKAKISKDMMSSYVTMRALPTKTTLEKIAKVLKCKPEDLMPSGKIDSTVMEVREHTKPGWKVLIIRAPVPTSIAMRLYQEIMEAMDAKTKD